MKRSFGKKAAIAFCFVGACGAMLFGCWWIFAMIQTRKINLGVLSLVATGLLGAWEGFKMFQKEKHSD